MNQDIVALRRAYAKLKQINETKAEFLADISHELKTPLTVLQGNISLSLKNFDPETKRDLRESVKRLNDLASDLLDLARAESGSLSLKKELIHPREVFNAIRAEAEFLARKRQIDLQWKLDDGNARRQINLDPGKISKVALNLISNAIKYTPRGGHVLVASRVTSRVASHLTPRQFIFSVTDTGIGIPKSELPYIFDRFYRSRLVKGKKVEGTGLGLAICKWIVQAHNGEIAVESEEGRGSEFTVKLPLA